MMRKICCVSGKLGYGYLAVAGLTLAWLLCASPGNSKGTVLILLPVLMGIGCVLACLIVVCRFAFNGTKEAEQPLWKPPLWVGLLIAILVVNFAFPYYGVKREVEVLRSSVGLRNALALYAEDHDGKLPGGFDALVREGYVRRTWGGSYEVMDGLYGGLRIASPDWFDVAWNTDVRDIDRRGRVVGMERNVIMSGKGALQPLGLLCADMSQSLPLLIEEMRRDSTTQPAK